MNKTRIARRAAPLAGESLEAALEIVAALGPFELRSLWLRMTGQSAPKALSRDLFSRMVAHRMQEERLGKLGREMRQRLDGLARGRAEPVRHLKVGTVMVREHQGAMHEVMVVPGGFCWKEKTYPSLSAIALAITGTSWNGPRFFGLRGKSGTEPPVDPASIIKDAPRTATRSSVRSMSLSARGCSAQNTAEGRP